MVWITGPCALCALCETGTETANGTGSVTEDSGEESSDAAATSPGGSLTEGFGIMKPPMAATAAAAEAIPARKAPPPKTAAITPARCERTSIGRWIPGSQVGPDVL